MPYVVAALVASALLLVEQCFVQHLWFRFDALIWWVLRLTLEAAFAVVLTGVLLGSPKALLSLNGVLLGLVAGIAAPRAFGRVQIRLWNRNLNPVNLAYTRGSKPLNEFIDESSAEAQRVYVETVIRPAARAGDLRPGEIAEAFRRHLAGRRHLTEVELTERLSFISGIEEDTVPDDLKVAALVLRAWQIGAYKALQHMLRPLPRRRYGVISTSKRALSRMGINWCANRGAPT
jgi:hypothetical protein